MQMSNVKCTVFEDNSGALEIARVHKFRPLTKHLNWRWTWLEEYERKEGHSMKSFTVIMDFKGLHRRHLTPSSMSVGQEISKLVTDNCPAYAKHEHPASSVFP